MLYDWTRKERRELTKKSHFYQPSNMARLFKLSVLPQPHTLLAVGKVQKIFVQSLVQDFRRNAYLGAS